MPDIDRSDPRYWKWGIFYYNPHDRSTWLPKRSGLGWTLNFARWMAYIWVVLLLAFIIWDIAHFVLS